MEERSREQTAPEPGGPGFPEPEPTERSAPCPACGHERRLGSARPWEVVVCPACDAWLETRGTIRPRYAALSASGLYWAE